MATSRRNAIQKNLDILVEEGVSRKVEVPDGPNRFDFTLRNHYHVRCVKCSEIFDADMDEITEFAGKIRNIHGIEFLDYDISFKGICPKCREKNSKENGGKRNGSKQIRRNADREKFTGGICRRISGKK